MNKYHCLVKNEEGKYNRLYEWSSYRVLKITTESETYFKVFGANSSDWRINSGITKVVYNEEYIAFFGYTGSVYVCPIGEYRMSMFTMCELNSITALPNVELVEHDNLFSVLKEHGIEAEVV